MSTAQTSAASMQATETIVAEARRLVVGRDTPIVVAIDGASGSGKSTLASLVAAQLGAALVHSDDFISDAYILGITQDAAWFTRTPQDCVAEALDWPRLRGEVLGPLRAGRPARWRPLVGVDGTVARYGDVIAQEPTAVVVFEGVTSTRSELTDLMDLAVLVEVPTAVQHGRLVERWGVRLPESPFGKWGPVEGFYLARMRPASSFDLIVSTVDES